MNNPLKFRPVGNSEGQKEVTHEVMKHRADALKTLADHDDIEAMELAEVIMDEDREILSKLAKG